MDRATGIDWTAYDLLESFRVFDAACLWVGIEPTREVWRVPPPNVTAMVRTIEQHAGGHHSSGIATASQGWLDSEVEVRRGALIKMANQLKQKPAFLFPEGRTGSGKPQEAEMLGERAETTYLNIIGGLLGLMLGKTPAGKPQSVFDNQSAIISAMLANYENKPGIAERTLEEKFAAAKRSLTAT